MLANSRHAWPEIFKVHPLLCRQHGSVVRRAAMTTMSTRWSQSQSTAIAFLAPAVAARQVSGPANPRERIAGIERDLWQSAENGAGVGRRGGCLISATIPRTWSRSLLFTSSG